MSKNLDLQYEEYFKPELDSLNQQSQENDKLYKEVHSSMSKNLDRLNSKQMYGTSSPHRDIAEVGKVLNDIRGNQVQIIKEKANIKKTIIDLDIRKENSKASVKDSNTNEALMQDILREIRHGIPNISKPTHSEVSSTKGKDELAKIDPKSLGLNENDLSMIKKFKNNSGNK
jgi:hypothetical protein